MRKISRVYYNGDRRIREGFLLIPRSVIDYENRSKETRWLEYAKWEEECSSYMSDKHWWTVRFIDDDL